MNAAFSLKDTRGTVETAPVLSVLKYIPRGKACKQFCGNLQNDPLCSPFARYQQEGVLIGEKGQFSPHGGIVQRLLGFLERPVTI